MNKKILVLIILFKAVLVSQVLEEESKAILHIDTQEKVIQVTKDNPVVNVTLILQNCSPDSLGIIDFYPLKYSTLFDNDSLAKIDGPGLMFGLRDHENKLLIGFVRNYVEFYLPAIPDEIRYDTASIPDISIDSVNKYAPTWEETKKTIGSDSTIINLLKKIKERYTYIALAPEEKYYYQIDTLSLNYSELEKGEYTLFFRYFMSPKRSAFRTEKRREMIENSGEKQSDIPVFNGCVVSENIKIIVK